MRLFRIRRRLPLVNGFLANRHLDFGARRKRYARHMHLAQRLDPAAA